MWIKICGNTTLEDAQLAASYGADAVGFVFAPSPRRVTAETVSRITAQLPKTLEKYGVFVGADFDEIVTTVEQCGLTGAQLHSASALAPRLRAHFAGRLDDRKLSIVRVLHYNAQIESQLDTLRQDPATDTVLVDSHTTTAVGGTGVNYDWQGARSIFNRCGGQLRLIAAGGLSPENVAEAIFTLKPWGVDVASGVETSPGRKHRERLRDFIWAARKAAADLSETHQPIRA